MLKFNGLVFMFNQTIFLLSFSLLSLAWPLVSKISLPHGWDLLLQEGRVQKSLENFNGLSFGLPANWQCHQQTGEKQCRPIDQSSSLVLRFKKIPIKGESSLPLVRLMRKKQWQSQGLSQISESEISTALGLKTLQSGKKYKLNNILWPLLISAFDVVIDNTSCLSVTTECLASEWPYRKEELDKIYASFKWQRKIVPK